MHRGTHGRLWGVASGTLAALVGLLCLCVFACSGKTTQAGGLEVILMTDLATPDVFDTVRLEIGQESAPGVFHTWAASDYEIPSEVTLPTTISIAAGSAPDQDALIRVTARKGTRALVLREVQVQVPKDRVAELRLVIAASCVGKVSVDSAGDAQTACSDPTQSCQPTTGECGPTVVNPSTLPTYAPADVPASDAGPPLLDGPAQLNGPDGGSSDIVSDGGAGSAAHSDAAMEPKDATVADNDAADAGPGASDAAPQAVEDGSVYSEYVASDLAPPAAGTGLQIATPAGMYAVQPNQEIVPNYCVTLPNTAPIDVGGLQTLLSAGGFQVTVYKGTPTDAGGCALGGGTFLYEAISPGRVNQVTLPSGVGWSFAAGAQLVLNLHFINTGTTTIEPVVKLNLLYATNVQYQAAALVAFNTSINVPASTAMGPGTQTVSGTCTAPAGSNFFFMTTRTFKHGTAAVVDFIHGGQSQEIVHTGASASYPADQEPSTGGDWSTPGVAAWPAPAFLTVSTGDTFKYSCSYSNSGSTAVTVGETAANNEQCMPFGFYFPAGSASCN